jgi:hypothetical protein
MPSLPANGPSSPTEQAALPSQLVRTIVSLALFIYLFTLAVGVAARDLNESPLEATLGQVQGLRHLRQLLWIDDSYDYYLTHAEEIDVDHSITADVTMPDGSTKTISLPDPEIRSPLGRRHWQMLAYRLALYSTVPDLEPARDIVTQGLAARILAETGGKSASIRVRGHRTPPELARYDPRDEKLWQNYRDVYAARAWISGGRVNLLKQESKADTAPAARTP